MNRWRIGCQSYFCWCFIVDFLMQHNFDNVDMINRRWRVWKTNRIHMHTLYVGCTLPWYRRNLSACTMYPTQLEVHSSILTTLPTSCLLMFHCQVSCYRYIFRTLCENFQYHNMPSIKCKKLRYCYPMVYTTILCNTMWEHA